MATRSTKTPSHASQLQAAFKGVNDGPFIALANIGQTQDHGWDAIREELVRRGLKQATCVFWHQGSHRRAFDKAGALVGGLVLHWSGVKSDIAAFLQSIDGFEVVVPKSDAHGFVIRVAGASVRPDPANTQAVIQYLENMDLTPEILLEDSAQQWLVDVATRGTDDARRQLLEAIHNERELPRAVVDMFHDSEAKLIDEDYGFHYLNLLARNDPVRYRAVVRAWAGSVQSWQRFEAAFMIGDSQGRLGDDEGPALLEQLMRDPDPSVVENAVRSWMIYHSNGEPQDRVRLSIEILNDAGRSKLIKKFAAANVSLVSEMTSAQAAQIMALVTDQHIELDKSDLGYFKKRLKK